MVLVAIGIGIIIFQNQTDIAQEWNQHCEDLFGKNYSVRECNSSERGMMQDSCQVCYGEKK